MNVGKGRIYYRDQVVTRLHSVMWVCLCIQDIIIIIIHVDDHGQQLYHSVLNHTTSCN